MGAFIIAEIGINHNGDVAIAKKLIEIAKESGCDAVKFQKRTIDLVYTQEFLNSPRQSLWGNTQRDQKMGLEFDQDDYEIIDAYCQEKKITWFASAWDVNSQQFLKQFDLKYNKIASAMIVDIPLLQEVAKERKHTFISTGMSTEEMITKACNIFKENNCPYELMHCVSVYPCSDINVNLSRITTLRNKFGCMVGYSGHENGIAISCAAVGLGISSLERHITIERTMYGSDQAASLEPIGLEHLVGSVRKIEQAMGNGFIEMQNIEAPIAEKLRSHIKK